MPNCKRCQSQQITKNGFVRSKQRYRCKGCGYNFVLGDGRIDPQTAVKRAFAVILYSVGKASYRFIAKLFDVAPSTVQKWLVSEAALIDTPQIPPNCRELELDEMWHFIGSKKTNGGLSKQFLVQPAEPLLGLLAVVMLIPSADYTPKSNT